MSKSIKTIQQVLEYIQEFYSVNNREPNDLQEFVVWLNDAIFDTQQTHDSGEDEKSLDMELSYLFVSQSKQFKLLARKILSDTPISSADEYSFLYHLSLAESFRKMELINIHLLEAPSGIEIIKRLLKKELIREFDDHEDKRAKRISITPEGRRLTEKIMPLMQQVYSDLCANLTVKEKHHIISYLKKQNHYHKE